MKFLSPFINMALRDGDFIRLLQKLEYYMDLELEYEGEGEDLNTVGKYPIGRIGDIQLHFNHYHSFEYAREKWNERKQRINWNNIFLEVCSDDMEEIRRFDELPYKNKIIFVPFECQYVSAVNIGLWLNPEEKDVKAELKRVANRMALGGENCYNTLKLLSGRHDFLRS